MAVAVVAAVCVLPTTSGGCVGETTCSGGAGAGAACDGAVVVVGGGRAHGVASSFTTGAVGDNGAVGDDGGAGMVVCSCGCGVRTKVIHV